MTPAFSDSDLRVLAAIMTLADRGEVVTLRRIRDLMGRKDMNYLVVTIHRFRKAKIITCEYRNHRIVSGTIRPALRFIPAREMP